MYMGGVRKTFLALSADKTYKQFLSYNEFI